jgi:hypothetical protein
MSSRARSLWLSKHKAELALALSNENKLNKVQVRGEVINSILYTESSAGTPPCGGFFVSAVPVAGSAVLYFVRKPKKYRFFFVFCSLIRTFVAL